MSDPFLDAESGIETSSPREFYQIVQDASTTYRIASGDRDITYGGNMYTASPSARTDLSIVTTTGDMALVLTLPTSHALAQRWMAMGSPPRQVTVTVYRSQSGTVESIYVGQVVSVALERHTMKFQIQSRVARMLDRRVCSFVAQKLCPHTLYDANCTVDPTAFSVTTTVISFDGRRVVIDGSNAAFGDQNFALLGDFLHVATNERQLIITESAVDASNHVTLDLQAPIPLTAGDGVVVRAGCAHTIATCHDKFNNLVHYGGMPEIPTVDLFIPGNKIGSQGSH